MPRRPATSVPSSDLPSGAPGQGLGLVRLMARGVVRRCPRCGSWRAWFRGWFRRRDRCVGCGLRWDRGTEGHELGSMTVNLLQTMAVLIVALVIALVSMHPDVDVATLVIVFVVLATLLPIVGYPVSQTVWMAIDLRVRRPQADEVADAAAAVARAASGDREVPDGDPSVGSDGNPPLGA